MDIYPLIDNFCIEKYVTNYIYIQFSCIAYYK